MSKEQLHAKVAELEYQLQIKNIQQQYIFSSVPANIYCKDKNGRYTMCNDQQAKMLGYTSGRDIVGKTDFDLSWKEQAPVLKKIDQNVIDSKNESIIEEPLDLPDGGKAIFLSKKIPMYTDETKQEIVGILGVSINIADKKRAEELAKEKEIAERTISYLKIIATSIAHEIQNPLAGIQSSADVGRIMAKKAIAIHQEEVEAKLVEAPKGKTLPEKIKDYFEKIIGSVNTANAYIAMQLANMRADKIDTSEFTQCSISKIVKDALNTYSFDNEQQQALVHWQDGKDFTFHGSPRLTKHVLLNLLSNALHYIVAEKKGDITIWLESDNKYNYLHFKDTAKGMPPGMAKKVFDQFFSKRKNGTGLGLSLCKMVMQAYQGDISCMAEEDKYVQFTLQFPKEK